jgi:hypothetical protein
MNALAVSQDTTWITDQGKMHGNRGAGSLRASTVDLIVEN